MNILEINYVCLYIYSSSNSSNLSPLSPLQNDTLDEKNPDFRCLWNHQIMVLRQEGLQIHLLPKHLDQGKEKQKTPTIYIYIYMGVSLNGGTPKSSILIGISIINHPVWGAPISWKHPYTYREVSFHLVSSRVLVSWCFLAATGPVESRQLCLFRVST